MDAAPLVSPSAKLSPKFIVMMLTPETSTPASSIWATAVVPSSVRPKVAAGSVSQTARSSPAARRDSCKLAIAAARRSPAAVSVRFSPSMSRSIVVEA